MKARVLGALEARAKQFRTREALYPIRVPHEPVLLDDVIEEALGEEQRRFDPLTLRARTLLRLEWDDGSAWEAWVAMLSSGLRLFCDTGPEAMHVLASGGRNAGDETDRLFLTRLAESAGQDFGIEMGGGAPSRVRASIADRSFLVDIFVTLFEETGLESALRSELAALERVRLKPATTSHPGALRDTGADFRADVDRWLGYALKT